jgi:hypothetical protein
LNAASFLHGCSLRKSSIHFFPTIPAGTAGHGFGIAMACHSPVGFVRFIDLYCNQHEGPVGFVEVDQIRASLLFQCQAVRHDDREANGRKPGFLEDLCGKGQIPDGVEARKRRE